MERHRSQILIGGGVMIALIFAGLVFVGSTQQAYACSIQLDPVTPVTNVTPSSTPNLGQIEDDMGRTHVTVGTQVRYTFCPPASGPHYNASGQGPIQPRFYGPDDSAIPEGWIHNLEHGGLVVLYNCNLGGCDQTAQDQLRALVGNVPEQPDLQHPERPVIACHCPVRHDEDAVRGLDLGTGPVPGHARHRADRRVLQERTANARTRSSSAPSRRPGRPRSGLREPGRARFRRASPS